MKEVYIYTLSCPLTNDIRYIGQSTNPKVRYRRHISDSKKRKDHKSNWIRSLLNKNMIAKHLRKRLKATNQL
jgi:predicted GIY-YIG superfamily endonuclease